MNRVLTTEEAAVLLRVNSRTLSRWLRKGKIPGRKVGRSWLIPEASLLQWLKGSPARSSTSPPLDPKDPDVSAHPLEAIETPGTTFDPTSTPIWERFAEILKDVPEEEIRRLPPDGAEQHDHYIYGLPKRSS